MSDKPIVFDSRRELKIARRASGLTLPRNRMVLSLKLSESRRSVGMTTPWPHISQSINHPQTTSLQSFLKRSQRGVWQPSDQHATIHDHGNSSLSHGRLFFLSS